MKFVAIQIMPINNRWAVKKYNFRRASKVFDTKEDALEYGLKLSKAQNSNLYIHTEHGTVDKVITPKPLSTRKSVRKHIGNVATVRPATLIRKGQTLRASALKRKV
jgi:hypothetical protein